MLGMRCKLLLKVVAGAGALFLGYCVYLDRKRRADPDYKRKVHEQRRLASVLKPCPNNMRRHEEMPDRENSVALQRLFLAEIDDADRLMRTGHTEAGLDHLVKAVMLCCEPESLLEMLQTQLPDIIYDGLLVKLRAVIDNACNNSTNSDSNRLLQLEALLQMRKRPLSEVD